MENQPRLTGIDRQLEILNRMARWVQSLNDDDRMLYLAGETPIPKDVFSEKDFRELVEIGTARQILDAAMQGITISDPREKELDSDIID